jgi:uncharacterized protein YjbI with pentapeptide repeats
MAVRPRGAAFRGRARRHGNSPHERSKMEEHREEFGMENEGEALNLDMQGFILMLETMSRSGAHRNGSHVKEIAVRGGLDQVYTTPISDEDVETLQLMNGFSFRNCLFMGVDFSGVALETVFSKCTFRGCRFGDATVNIAMKECVLTNVYMYDVMGALHISRSKVLDIELKYPRTFSIGVSLGCGGTLGSMTLTRADNVDISIHDGHFEHFRCEEGNEVSIHLTRCVVDDVWTRMTRFDCVRLFDTRVNHWDARESVFGNREYAHRDDVGLFMDDCVLHNVDFSRSVFYEPRVSNCSLNNINLSGSEGFYDPTQYLRDNFLLDDKGVLGFKIFGAFHPAPRHWRLDPGNFITEVANPDPTVECGCGINIGTARWVNTNRPIGMEDAQVWLCRINWIDLASVVVPITTDGKIRANRVELIEKMDTHTFRARYVKA